MSKKLNMLDTILREIATLKEENEALKATLHVHEERLNNLNIPDSTVQAIAVRVLDTHAQILLAVTRPQPTQQEAIKEPEKVPLD